MTRAGEKMLTTTLAVACGVLFVVALAMQFGLGRGYHWLEVQPDSANVAAAGAIDREPFQLPPQTNFAAIEERPLFNEDRKPGPEGPDTGTVDTPPPTPLNISLTGTLISGKPEVRVAMVRENGKAETVGLKEGMPLPGEQGAWTLSQVKKRSAIFKSSTGEEVEVELAVVTAGQKSGLPTKPGAPVPPNRVASQPAGAPPVPGQSEELQHRIEERRKQMREAAERMKAQRQNEPPPPPPQGQQQQ
jgi:general secretion pathway protein N